MKGPESNEQIQDFLQKALARAEKLLSNRYDADAVSALFAGREERAVEKMLRDLEGRLIRGRIGEQDRIRSRWLTDSRGFRG